MPNGCQSASVPRKCRPGCETKHPRRTGRNARDLGTLRFDAQGAQESGAFAYDAEWLGAGDGFAIDPGLPSVTGPQFHSRERGGSVFHGAIADTEPDGWARRVILCDHAKRRQEAKRTGTDVENRPLNAFGFLLAVDDVSRVGALRFNARFAASFIKVGLANVCSHEGGRPRPNAGHGSKPVDHRE
jgi:hypothetical protein